MENQSINKKKTGKFKLKVTEELKQEVRMREEKMRKATLSDGERSSIWGIKNATIAEINEGFVPFCFNPENNHAVVVFEGRRRRSSVIAAFNTSDVHIIRSKEVIPYFLGEQGEFGLIYEYGLTEERIFGEFSKAVQIARIIKEFELDSSQDLYDYLLKERVDLFDALARYDKFFEKALRKFKSPVGLKEINETLKKMSGLSRKN